MYIYIYLYIYIYIYVNFLKAIISQSGKFAVRKAWFYVLIIRINTYDNFIGIKYLILCVPIKLSELPKYHIFE